MTRTNRNNTKNILADKIHIFRSAPVCGKEERIAYRRKKALHKKAMTIAIVVMAFTMLTGGMLIALAKDNSETHTNYSEFVVDSGDSLWSIAKECFPDSDPRDVIQEIREINDLNGFTIYSGKVLLIPADI